MKKILNILAVLFVFALISCAGKPDRPDAIIPSNSTSVDVNPVTTTPGATPPAGSVPHYICPDNCGSAGGDSAAPCPGCGKTLVHNQAFHSQPNQTPPAGINDPAITPPPPPINNVAQPEPPQNANGVWHYTCSNGCAGGSGSAQACAGCGSTLVHNTAYHN